MEEMIVPPARPGSWEQTLHRLDAGDRVLITAGLREYPEFREPRAHRAIGVVYNPEREQAGNYVPTVLPYDAFLFLDESKALHPLPMQPEREPQPPETFPWGV